MSSLSTKDMQGKKLTQKSKLLWYPSSSQQGNDSKSIIVKENTCNRAIFLVCMGTALNTGITACCYSRKKHTWLTFASYTFVTGGVWKSKMKWILRYVTIEEEAHQWKPTSVHSEGCHKLWYFKRRDVRGQNLPKARSCATSWKAKQIPSMGLG